MQQRDYYTELADAIEIRRFSVGSELERITFERDFAGVAAFRDPELPIPPSPMYPSLQERVAMTLANKRVAPSLGKKPPRGVTSDVRRVLARRQA